MPICYLNPDGSHTRGCDRHNGEHPYDWCRTAYERRAAEMAELRTRLNKLELEDVAQGDELRWVLTGKT